MKESLLQFFSNIQLFEQDEINAIVAHTQVEHFKKGAIILKEKEVSSKCYFVLTGCVRQYCMIDGEEKTTAFFTEKQVVISYASYMHSSSSQYYLSCVDHCILISGTREQEEELHRTYPKLKFLVYALIKQDYLKTQERLATMVNYSPEERYLDLLKTQPELLSRAPLHQIASFIGVTPESFSRIRKRIIKKEKAGLLRF